MLFKDKADEEDKKAYSVEYTIEDLDWSSVSVHRIHWDYYMCQIIDRCYDQAAPHNWLENHKAWITSKINENSYSNNILITRWKYRSADGWKLYCECGHGKMQKLKVINYGCESFMCRFPKVVSLMENYYGRCLTLKFKSLTSCVEFCKWNHIEWYSLQIGKKKKNPIL